MRTRLILLATTGEIVTKPPQILIHSQIVSNSDSLQTFF